jgi:serine/threonine-protein kinase
VTDLDPGFASALADRYAIERAIGSGGMATVYLAEDLKHRRRVAVKVLRPGLLGAMGPDRFLREIDVVAKLTHPNILPLHDSGVLPDAAGRSEGRPYFVMPFVEGESLRERLRREPQLPLDEAVRISEEIADALNYAHQRGVVHRDIKPENVLLEAGHAVLSDFGIARVTEVGAPTLTATGFAVGTPAYMSPEQAAGDRAVDQRSDLYSLGCLLYEMLAGEPPFTGPTPQAILARALSEEVRPLTTIRPAVSGAVEAVIKRSLARSPADRFATAGEMKAALRAATSVPAGATTTRRSRRIVPTLAAALGIAAVALGLRVALRSTGPRDGGSGLAVFPFQATGPAAADWGEQFADLLATAVDGTPGLKVADPWSLWSALRPARGARAESPADAGEADRLARQAGARFFLLGSLRTRERSAPADSAHDDLTVTARLYRGGERDPVHTTLLSGSSDDVGPLVHRLAVELIGRLSPRDSAAPDLEGFTTRSAPALKAYLRARAAMRRGMVDEAEAAIDSALAADTTFALGLVEAARIKSWALFMRGQPYVGLPELLRRAARYRDSLSPRNRLRLEATQASIETNGPAAAGAARRILALDSTDFDAWTSLAYYHRVYGWQYGSDERDVLAALERAMALDSTHVPTQVALLSLLQHLDDPRADQVAEALRRTDSVSVLARGTLLAHRVLTLDEAGFAGFVDTLAAQSPVLLPPVLRGLRSRAPDRAVALVQRLTARRGPGIPDYRGEWARLLAAQGRYVALDSAMQAAAFPMQTLPRWFLLAPQLGEAGDSVLAAQAVTFLQALIPPDSALAMFERMPVWINGWMVGAYHAANGDSTVARRWQSTIGALPAGGTPQDYRGALQADLEARLLERRGDLAGALGAASRAYQLWGIHTDNVPEYHPEPALRFHQAMLLLATGRPDSAAALLRSLVPPTTWMGFLTARASLELGRLAEDRGDRDDAARHYGVAYRLWRRADTSVAAWRDAAREGLRRVSGEPLPPEPQAPSPNP